MYLPTIVGYVPNKVVRCISTFLDLCYITFCGEINGDTLNEIEVALRTFTELCEVFRTAGVRPTGFSLPRLHVLEHYRRLIEDFGAPAGLHSPLEELTVTAMKRKYPHFNRYASLGQRLVYKQRLDNLAAMRDDFAKRGMLIEHDPKSQSNHDEDPNESNGGDEEAVKGQVTIGHVTLAHPSESRKFCCCANTPCLIAGEERGYPQNINQLARHIEEPNLQLLTTDFLAQQLNSDTINSLNTSAISVFHSAGVTFLAPNDTKSTRGIRDERIWSTPTWKGPIPRRDCAFVFEDETKPGTTGMGIVRVMLFFSFEYDNVYYPCALVEWFRNVGPDPVTGMWVVRPDVACGRRVRSVIHLDILIRAAHLIPVFDLPVRHDLHFSQSLDSFDTYYVNKYIDYHTYNLCTR